MAFERHMPSVEGFTGKPTIHRAMFAVLQDKVPTASNQPSTWWTTTSNLFLVSGTPKEFLTDYGLGHKGIRVVDHTTYSAFEVDPGYYLITLTAEIESNATTAQAALAIAEENLDGTIKAAPLSALDTGVDTPAGAIMWSETTVADFQTTSRIVVGITSRGAGTMDVRKPELLIVKLGDRDG